MTTSEHNEPRPGERVQTWWCRECGTEHTASVIGGLVVPKLEAPKLRSLVEAQLDDGENEVV